jgi:hypothetical protein
MLTDHLTDQGMMSFEGVPIAIAEVVTMVYVLQSSCLSSERKIKNPDTGRASYESSQLTSFGFSFHHHEVLLLGSFLQHFAVDTFFLPGLSVTDKVSKWALGAFTKT